MSQQKVLFVSQEILPYLPSTPLSEYCNRLPRVIQDSGYEVRLFSPKYGNINERRNQLHEVIRLSGLNIIIDDTDHPLVIKVATLQSSRTQVYFIDNDDYFNRHPSSELETVSAAEENDERAIFFVRGVAETVKKLRWDPVIIQCTGWVTSLMPIYLKRVYNDDPAFKKAKVIYTLFDDAATLPQNFNADLIKKLKADGITARYVSSLKNVEPDHKVLNKLAMDFADAIVQGSEGIDPELIEYAKATGKPFLEYPGEPEDAKSAYAEFYASLLNPAK